MNATVSISLSGLRAAQTQLQVSAHNIANAQTPAFRRQQVAVAAVPDGGVSTALTQAGPGAGSLEDDMVAQLQAKNAFFANLAVFRASRRMSGALIDTVG